MYLFSWLASPKAFLGTPVALFTEFKFKINDYELYLVLNDNMNRRIGSKAGKNVHLYRLIKKYFNGQGDNLYHLKYL